MNDLIDLDALAVKVGQSRQYARDKLVKRADFPRPALMLSQKVRKWSLVDVNSWLEKQKRMLAH
jgi:predicted DNA-binding transcriptional regulator AlpA